MTKFLGIDFAPLAVPFHRRMETLAAIHFVFAMVIMSSLTVVLTLYLLFTSYYWLALLYLTWLAIDRRTPSRGGRRATWFRNLDTWKHLANYFPIKLFKTSALDPTNNYIFAYHPHGILGIGSYAHFGTEGTNFSELFPGIKPYLLIMKIMLSLPIVHDYYMLPGCCDVSKDSIHYILEENGKGNAAIILVGGAKESLESTPGKCKVLIKKRKGFCKMALKHGAHLVPVYSFGEEELYTQVDNPEGSTVRNIQNYLQKWMGFAIPFFHGRGIFNYNFGLLPHRRAINTFVGSPIPVEKVPEPTDEQVNALHDLYMQKLKDLFDEYKVQFEDYAEKELIYI
ncbi:2-acylglycerol O-acyltransferase 1-like [Ptychodera flava]|uniref:2-acylglycerol O-acyltransferase 1-like n=1 Tax=Ptychodera flava TaxID=63121 RepID=UPI00396A2339